MKEMGRLPDFIQINRQVLDVFTAGQAREEEAEELTALLVETAVWLKSKGSSQWSSLLEGNDAHGTANAISRGEVFVFKAGARIAAMVILMQHPSAWDYRLWGGRAYSGDGALYLHRLAVRRPYAKLGLGAAILDWCENGVRAENKRLIRLDTLATSVPLNALYSGNGYTRIGEQDGFALYEKPLPGEG